MITKTRRIRNVIFVGVLLTSFGRSPFSVPFNIPFRKVELSVRYHRRHPKKTLFNILSTCAIYLYRLKYIPSINHIIVNTSKGFTSHTSFWASLLLSPTFLVHFPLLFILVSVQIFVINCHPSKSCKFRAHFSNNGRQQKLRGRR